MKDWLPGIGAGDGHITGTTGTTGITGIIGVIGIIRTTEEALGITGVINEVWFSLAYGLTII